MTDSDPKPTAREVYEASRRERAAALAPDRTSTHRFVECPVCGWLLWNGSSGPSDVTAVYQFAPGDPWRSFECPDCQTAQHRAPEVAAWMKRVVAKAVAKAVAEAVNGTHLHVTVGSPVPPPPESGSLSP
jgi:hypothetical protein